MILLITSFLIFWAYCIYACETVGIKSSISETYFHVKRPNILFRGFLFGISIPLMFYAHNLSTGLLLSATLISWVGIAPGSKSYVDDKIENRNHVIGATGGILTAFGAFLIEFVDWMVFTTDLFFWSVVGFILGSFIVLPVKGIKKGIPNHTTWIEVFAYNVVIVTLIISEIKKL